MILLRVIILSKQYTLDGPLGGRCRSRHLTHTSSLHPHDHSKRYVMVNTAVRKLRNSPLPEISKAPMSEVQGSNPGWSDSKYHPIHHVCYPHPTCLLHSTMKQSKLNIPWPFLNTFIFTFMGDDPKVDHHEFLNLLKKKKVTVLSICWEGKINKVILFRLRTQKQASDRPVTLPRRHTCLHT